MPESRDWHTHEEFGCRLALPKHEVATIFGTQGIALLQVYWLSFSMASRGYALVHEHEAHPNHCTGLQLEVLIC